MRLALLSPVHGQSIEHIARQLENYRIFLAPFQLCHYLHVSLESSADLKEKLVAFAEQEGHDIVFTKRSRITSRPCTANALCELIKTALADERSHDKVLIHTDTDLLFSTKAIRKLQKHSIGCGDSAFRGDEGRWKWAAKALADPRIQRFTTEMLDGDTNGLRMGRVCGAFMPWGVFKPFGALYNQYFDNRYFEKQPKRHWPLTEIAIPTILRLLQGPNVRFRSPLIKVPNNTAISQRTIERLIRRGDSCGIKKVARDPDSDAFRYLMRLQAEAHQGS
ncbi:MAG: hypothetical protein CMN95_08825 [Synechococcus sp. MED650]|nr:hypothetical protein [Synechococcus sp. MED650]